MTQKTAEETITNCIKSDPDRSFPGDTYEYDGAGGSTRYIKATIAITAMTEYAASQTEQLRKEVEEYLNREDKENIWIPITDRLPDDDSQLCVFAAWYQPWGRWLNIEAMTWGEIKYWRNWELKNSWSHWMPLPNRP